MYVKQSISLEVKCLAWNRLFTVDFNGGVADVQDLPPGRFRHGQGKQVGCGWHGDGCEEQQGASRSVYTG